MCKSITCLNGGNCSERLGSYSCVCLQGWTGQFCGTSKSADASWESSDKKIEAILLLFTDK